MDILNVILTSLLSVAALFLLAKIMGHRQISQLDLFDYIAGITIGSIAAELATELEHPWKPLIALLIYCGVTFGFNIITSKYPKLRKYINGTPTVIMDNGKLYRKNMKKAKLDLSEFMVMCREAGYFNLSDIQTAVFEYNGKLAILPVSDKRPMLPADNGIKPKQETISTEVIMDGRVMDENLKRMGLDDKWLQKQLEEQGFQSANEVFLGLCDTNHKLTLFNTDS
ncbi:MAG: YetF domain-containing protein [Faecousia sp.]